MSHTLEPIIMNEKSGFVLKLALFKQRYSRGSSWMQIILSFGIITANAKLFEDFFQIHLGLNMPEVIALSIPIYVLACYFIGHADETSGLWQAENDLGYRVTPLSEELLNTVRDIKKKVDAAVPDTK